MWALRELDGRHVVDVCELWADEGEFVKVGRVLAKDKIAFSCSAFTHIAMAGVTIGQVTKGKECQRGRRSRIYTKFKRYASIGQIHPH